MVRSIIDSSIEEEFLISDESPYFLITPVKFYVQQILLVKVISENVTKVPNHHITIYEVSLIYVFTCNFSNQRGRNILQG